MQVYLRPVVFPFLQLRQSQKQFPHVNPGITLASFTLASSNKWTIPGPEGKLFPMQK